MDPLSSINYAKDTSYYLLRAGLELGHRAFHIDQNDISLVQDQAYALCTEVTLTADKKLEVVAQAHLSLSDMRLIFVRTDPPFDRRYFYTTLMLDYCGPNTKVVNRPQALRDWNEKLAALEFPAFTPPTLVANQLLDFKRFAKDHPGRLVLKPIDGNGGKGIEFLMTDASDFDQVVQRKTEQGRRRIVVQAYVPQASKGDIRVLFLKDQVLGAILRVHAEGKELNNLDQGGSAHPHQLTPRQKEICQAMGPVMHKKGIDFVGIDFLGDHLIEINVTSPTGLQELCRFEKQDFHHRIISELY